MHAFLHNTLDTEVIVKATDDSITWPELTELYFNFLQASGYSVTRKEFADVVQCDFGDN